MSAVLPRAWSVTARGRLCASARVVCCVLSSLLSPPLLCCAVVRLCAVCRAVVWVCGCVCVGGLKRAVCASVLLLCTAVCAVLHSCTGLPQPPHDAILGCRLCYNCHLYSARRFVHHSISAFLPHPTSPHHTLTHSHRHRHTDTDTQTQTAPTSYNLYIHSRQQDRKAGYDCVVVRLGCCHLLGLSLFSTVQSQLAQSAGLYWPPALTSWTHLHIHAARVCEDVRHGVWFDITRNKYRRLVHHCHCRPAMICHTRLFVAPSSECGMSH